MPALAVAAEGTAGLVDVISINGCDRNTRLLQEEVELASAGFALRRLDDQRRLEQGSRRHRSVSGAL